MQQDGKLKVRKGGMRDRIVNGKQFEQPRRVSWAIKMKDDRINQILVKWYVTLDEYHKDIPTSMEGQLIQKYFNGHGKLPFWNIEY